MSTGTGGGSDADDGDRDHANADQSVVVVNESDDAQGTANRLEAHTGDGVRHRAFTCLVFDADGNLLLAQRAPDKRLWDSFWDGTVASHPTENQTQREAARERLAEELGVDPGQYEDLRVTDKFEYKRYYLDEGVEWEVCAVLQCTLTDRTLDPDPAEVGGYMWVPYAHLHDNPRLYRQLRLCPWFEIAMRRDFE
ncbi:MAG: isopentenyl-diphosphate Delta-isomerase [Haloarculaceae archaeon]